MQKLTFEDALLIAITAFIVRVKYVNIEKSQIYDALKKLFKVVEEDFYTYYNQKEILLSDNLSTEYFTKNYNIIGSKFADKWIHNVKLKIK